LLEIGKVKQVEAKTSNQNAAKTKLSQNDKVVSAPRVNTRQEIAKTAKTSPGQVGMAEHGVIAFQMQKLNRPECELSPFLALIPSKGKTRFPFEGYSFFV